MPKEKKLIAMLGGGQLGLMFTEIAQKMGEKVLILDPDSDCPAGKIADEFVNAKYSDKKALQYIAENCASCTTEFENIPCETLEILEKEINVFPNSGALKISQNRILEKKFLTEQDIQTTEYFEITSEKELDNLKNIKSWPYILKTSTFGYDGKGQIIVNNFKELKKAYQVLGTSNFILEKKVILKKEVSQIAACYDDRIIFLPISENIHVNNILHKSTVPAKISAVTDMEIKNTTKTIVNSLNYKGIICVEYFIDDNDNILVNEIAPRTHNSGHYSIEGCNISQFEHQVRILTKQHPSISELKNSSVMINLLGDLWTSNAPDFSQANKANIFLHLYNKSLPKVGRKMGHVTIVDSDLGSAEIIADKFYENL